MPSINTAKKKSGGRKIERFTCVSCMSSGLDRKEDSYRMNQSIIHESLGLCKECVKVHIGSGNKDDIYEMLQFMNLPFIEDFYQASYEAETETVGLYMRKLNQTNKMRVKSFKDSDFMQAAKNEKPEEPDWIKKKKIIEKADLNYEDMLRKYGIHLEMDEYFSLENIYQELGGEQADDDIEKAEYVSMTLMQKMAVDAYTDKDYATFNSLTKTINAQRKSLVEKRAKKKDSSMALGILTQQWEKTAPVVGQINYNDVSIFKFIKEIIVLEQKKTLNELDHDELQFLNELRKDYLKDEEHKFLVDIVVLHHKRAIGQISPDDLKKLIDMEAEYLEEIDNIESTIKKPNENDKKQGPAEQENKDENEVKVESNKSNKTDIVDSINISDKLPF